MVHISVQTSHILMVMCIDSCGQPMRSHHIYEKWLRSIWNRVMLDDQPSRSPRSHRWPILKWIYINRAHEGDLCVGCRLEIFRNVRRRLGSESVQCRAEGSVQCRASNSECRCRPTLILVWMSVSAGENEPVSGVGNTPFMGPINSLCQEVKKFQDTMYTKSLHGETIYEYKLLVFMSTFRNKPCD